MTPNFKLRTNLNVRLTSDRMDVDFVIPRGAPIAGVVKALGKYQPKEERFTVMLLRPDYATDNYGWDTFTETVSALGADEAIAEVKSLCAIADGRNLEINTYEYVQDLHVLAVMKGDVEFIQ